jgi:hypothetical protein
MKSIIQRWTRISAALVAGSVVLAVSSSSMATATTSTTQAVGLHVLSVVPCASINVASQSAQPGWVPTRLAATMPAASAQELEFYSAGTETVLGTLETLLGPRRWSCGQLIAGDGGVGMAVYPPGSANPDGLTQVGVSPGEQVVAARFDYTGHLPGVDVACPYFRSAAAARGVSCPSRVPAGEKVTQLTSDVVAIRDPAGVKGALAGSGGGRSVSGLMIMPQGSDLPSSVGIAEISCSLRSASLCSTILSDFVVRQFPVPVYPTP